LEDIHFRSGLILFVLILAGTFAGGLYYLAREDDEERAQWICDNLANAMREMIIFGVDSSLVISFGMDSIESGLDLPGEIGGGEYRIIIGSGIISLDSSEGRFIVMEYRDIIPSYPPLNQEYANLTSYNEIGVDTGGFSIRTPCALGIDILSSGNDILVFTHPHDIPPLEVQNSSEGIIEFLGTPPVYSDGLNLTHYCEFPYGALITSDFILLRSREIMAMGDCPYPIILTKEFRNDLHEIIPAGGGATFYRNTTKNEETFSVRSGIDLG